MSHEGAGERPEAESGAGAGLAERLAAAVDAVLERHLDGVLPIVQAGHPVLRQRALPEAGQLGPARLARLVEAMRTTMRAAPGVGLAAPQIGLPLAIAVIEDPGSGDAELDAAREREPVPFATLLNPHYAPVGAERVAHFEGCLSVAGWAAVRSRWRRVRLRAHGLSGEHIDVVLTGWPARIAQHECDHLLGELYLDAAEPRSLSAPGHAARWASEPQPRAAAEALGFDLS